MDPREHPESVDWGDQFDDFGPEYWEDQLGGPDDEFFEPEYGYAEEEDWSWAEDEFSVYGEPEYDDEESPEDASSDENGSGFSPDDCENRQDQIVEWLAQSGLARSLRSGDGFYVLKGTAGRLLSGESVEILGWLEGEGIVDGALVGGYRVRYTPPGGAYLEKLTFFRATQDNPFRGVEMHSASHQSHPDFLF